MFRRRNADRTAHVRRELVAEFVRDVHSQPFQAQVRRKPYGPPVVGWPARRSAYFWPTPERDLVVNETELGPLFEAAGRLSRTLRSRGSWTREERGAALRLAQAMLDWGGPRQPRSVDETTVERVFRRALRLPVAGDVPMGSGWSKVAVLATTYLEGVDGKAPHAIWDSRVSASILSRLDRILVARGIEDPRNVAPHFGRVPSTNGTRPRDLVLRWPLKAPSWDTQFAASVFVRDLRDHLNQNEYPPMPMANRANGATGPWTVRGVESVLFMDGY